MTLPSNYDKLSYNDQEIANVNEAKGSFTDTTMVPIILPDGKTGKVPAENLQAVLDQGVKLDTPENMAARKMTAEHPILSTLDSAEHQANEALFGAPEAIAKGVLTATKGKEEASKIDSPIAHAVQDQAETEHPYIVGGTRVAAEIAPALSGLGEIGGIAKGAEALVLGEKALAKAGLTTLAEEAAPSLARRALGSAARYGVEGAIVNAPLVASQAFNGDTDKAAETLLWGAGVGSLFGGASKFAEAGLMAGASAGEKYAAKYLAKYAEDITPEKVGEYLGAAANKATMATAATLGHGPGYFIAKELGLAEKAEKFLTSYADTSGIGDVASKWIKQLAEAPLQRGFGDGMAAQAISTLGQKIAKVPDAINALAVGEGNKYADDRRKISPEEAAHIGQTAIDLAANHQNLIDHTADLVHVLNHNDSSEAVSLALQNKMIQQVQYIADAAPKPPRPAGPFSKDVWQPSPLELASLSRKLEVLYDPFSTMHRLADGTLTQDHVSALKAMYPKIYTDMQKAVMETAAKPNAPKLSTQARQKLGLLMGVDLDPLSSPAATKALQAGFQPAPQAGGPPAGADQQAKRGPGRPPKVKFDNMPSSFTDSQNVQFTGSRRGGK